MNLERLRILIAPALAGLFLALALCTFAVRRPGATGIVLPMTRVRMNPAGDCADADRWTVVLLHKDGSYWINEDRVPTDELGSQLAAIYAGRKYKTVWMFADPDVSYGQFAQFYDIVSSSTPNLYIDLRTPRTQEELQHCPLGGSCGMEWPDHTFVPCVARALPKLRPPTARR